MAELAKYKDDTEAKIRSLTETSSTQMAVDLQLLVQRLGKDLEDGKERGIMYLTEMKDMVNTGNIQNRMEGYLRKLKKRVQADTEEIRKWVAWMSSTLPHC